MSNRRRVWSCRPVNQADSQFRRRRKITSVEQSVFIRISILKPANGFIAASFLVETMGGSLTGNEITSAKEEHLPHPYEGSNGARLEKMQEIAPGPFYHRACNLL